MEDGVAGAECHLDMTSIKREMINRLIQTNAHFKHQVRGEPDLNADEKYTIASELLEKNSGLFLERFSDYLTLDDINCFSDVKNDYAVSFYLKKIMDAHEGKNKNVVKNRRYQALQEMMDEGEYFSETEMQRRDPLLYDQLVGQFETEEEKQAKDIDKTDLRFSSILLKYMDKQELKSRHDRMKEREEEQEEEEDEETEDEETEDEEEEEDEIVKKENVDDAKEGDQITAASEGDRAEFRHEFLRIMQERFLSGEDSQFDYSQIDNNAEYDSLAILNHDAEDKYFNGDDDSMDADIT